jgi:hypothetical protein
LRRGGGDLVDLYLVVPVEGDAVGIAPTGSPEPPHEGVEPRQLLVLAGDMRHHIPYRPAGGIGGALPLPFVQCADEVGEGGDLSRANVGRALPSGSIEGGRPWSVCMVFLRRRVVEPEHVDGLREESYVPSGVERFVGGVRQLL